MEFREIADIQEVAAGEYLYHESTGQIGVCGQVKPDADTLKVLIHGRVVQDTPNQFKKIQLSAQEAKERKKSGCTGCKGR